MRFDEVQELGVGTWVLIEELGSSSAKEEGFQPSLYKSHTGAVGHSTLFPPEIRR